MAFLNRIARKFHKNILHGSLLLFVLVFSMGEAWGQTNGDYRTRGAGGNWNAYTTWQVYSGGWSNCTPGDYPGVNSGAGTVTILNNDNVTLNISPANSIGALVLQSGNNSSTLTNSATNSLVVTGAINIGAGTGNNDNKIIAVEAGTISCSSITVAATGGTNRNSGITLSTGTVTVSGDITMGDANDVFTFTGGGTLNIGGTMNGGTFTPSTGTVNYNNNGNQNIGVYTYYNLTTSTSGTKTLAGNITVGNNLTINAGTTLDLSTFTANRSAAGGTLTVAGNMLLGGTSGGQGGSNFPTNFSTLTMTGGTVNYDNAAGGQTVYATPAYNNLTLGNTSGTQTAGGALTVNGNLLVSAATLSAGANNIALAGNFTNNGTFTPGTGTVTFNGANPAVIDGSSATAFYNLTINKNASATTVTNAANVFSVGNNLLVTQGNLVLQATNADYLVTNNLTVTTNGTLTHSVYWDTVPNRLLGISGNLDIQGNYDYSAVPRTHIQMTGAGARTINTGTTALSILTLQNGTFSANGTVTVNDNFWSMFGTGGSFHTNGQNVTASAAILIAGGTLFIDGGTLNVTGGIQMGTNGNSIVNFSSGTLNVDNIVMGNGTLTGLISQSGGIANISGNITINSTGTYTFTNSPQANIAGNFTNSGTFNRGTGTLNFNGSSLQNIGGNTITTFNNLITNNAAGVSLTGSEIINGTLTLTSGNLILNDNNLNITNNAATAVQGAPFSASNMIETNGIGYVIRNAAAALPIAFPIGSGGYYSPMSIAARSNTNGTINVRAEQSFSLGSNYLEKFWDVVTSIGGKTITATFTYDPAEIPVAPTKIYYKPAAGVYQTPTGVQSFGTNDFTITGTTGMSNVVSSWTAGPVAGTYFSYQTGNWSDPTTWTSDPGGTTQVGTTVPGNTPDDVVVILSGRTVSLDANVSAANLEVNINDGGILDMKTFAFTNPLVELNGQGTLKLASVSFPSATTNNFVNTGGGTTEYNNTVDFTFPVGQTTYNNLTLRAPGVTATQLSNIALNGNLLVKQGALRINDNSTARRQLTIAGNVTVDAGASWTVGTGVTNTTTNPTATAETGTAPFLDYYDGQSHRVVITGDFTNNGTVRFTNQPYPVYNAFPSDGFATVYFQGATNNTLTCNGTTDFYNLVLDKGVDQSYSLTVYSNAYQNFRLFGANNAGGYGGGSNPNLNKALWIRTGTLILQGLTIIPSLSEGTCDSGTGGPNSDFFIPLNGSLVIDGTEVVVLSTADNFNDVNLAYSVAGPNSGAMGVSVGGCSSFSLYGKFQVNAGYFSTRESGGFITWSTASGQFVINGGTVDAKQFRAAGGGGGLASFDQSGGTFILRGRFQRTPTAYASINNLKDYSTATLNTSRAGNGTNSGFGTFNLNEAANVYSMSGGTIRVYDDCGAGWVFDVFSSTGNINVTGGTVEFIPTDGSGADAASQFVRSNAPFGNFTVNRASSATTIELNTYPLNVVSNLNLTSGVLTANNFNVSVGGNLTIANGTTYTPGTNWTVLNGAENQSFTINLASALILNKLKIDKPTGKILTLAGSQSIINVSDSLMIMKGTLADGGKILNFTTGATSTSYLYNSGVHTGAGKIVLADDDPQIIAGDGNGVFQNLELNNTDALTAPVSLNANMTVNGVLTLSNDKLFDIKNYNLKMGASATISGVSATRFVQTNGDAGDGGITKVYTAAAKSFLFPVGAASTSHAAAEYTPASLSFGTNPTTFGSITVIPVGYEQPNTTVKGRSLTYFWRTRSSGFVLGSATITQSYTYAQSDVVTGGDVTEAEYVPARYNSATYSWTSNAVTDIDDATNVIGGPGTAYAGVSFIDGEFTAGDDTPTNPFGVPTVYYSRINGAAAGSGLWSDVNSWSTTGHTGLAAASVPGASDVVIIGALDSIYLSNETYPLPNNNNPPNSYCQLDKALVNCGSLQIEQGSVLDIQNNPGCDFGIVLSHNNGNGTFRITTRNPTNFDAVATFAFPNGDFSEFNLNSGTTELYTINPQSGGEFYLPNNIASYGNLTISPLGGSNIMFGNTSVTIFGNLTTKGENSQSWFCPTWNGDYPTAPAIRTAKTITIQGDFRLEGGAFIYYGNNALAQDIIINGDFFINDPAGIKVYSNATNQSISIGGSLINNSLAPAGGANAYRGANFTNIPVIFFDANSASITNTNTGLSPYTIFDQVTINKGTSQTTILTLDIEGTLTTPTDNWLTLQNGTLRYMRNNPSSDFTISQGTALTIPATAGLYVDYPNNSGNRNVLIANAASNTNDLFLNGKLSVLNGKVYVGPTNGTTNNNNDIEYSGGGAAAIEVQNGQLVVNGQIRRNPATTNGILTYTQSGGNVVINGQAANSGNAKLEVTNGGSVFNMSGGTLTIVRGGGTTYGDLYIRPANSSVTGGDIHFTQSPLVGPVVDVAQNYILDANVPLNNLTITGKTAGTARNATVTLLISPLTLNGALTISNNRSIFDANTNYNINLTVKGGFTNNGAYNHYKNLTTFSGGVQTIQGSTATDFYNLTVNPITSLSLIRDVTVLNNLTLSTGQLLNSTYTVEVKGNMVNNANYNGDAMQGGVKLNGTALQQVSGTGTFGRLELNNANGARLLNSITLQKNLILTAGILDINQYLLTLGENSIIEGSGFSKTKMIASDGVFSNVGLRKYFGIYNGAAKDFTYPIGTSGKYTPVVLTYTDNESVGYVQINNINDNHPGVLDNTNVLDYYWEVSSFGITGLKASMVLNYLQEDVQVTGTNSESDYIGAALLVPGTSWAKVDNVDDFANTITFDYSSGINGINGQFTAGIDPALPDEVPEFTSVNTGDWADPGNWVQTGGDSYILTGAPNGFIVNIASGHLVNISTNYATAYRTNIVGELKSDLGTYGHNLGSVSGTGILNLESGLMPAGRYTDFFDCGSSAILEYSGSTNYTLIADLYSSIPKLHFTGSGIRTLPNKDLTICTQLLIDGATLDNSVSNKKLTIQGTMERINSGVFNGGSGAGAVVSFAGSAAQTIGGILGDFTGSNAFNYFEINNSLGLTINNGGAVEVAGNLMLTNGKINTSSTNKLTITNTLVASVIPLGGSPNSFVNGPLVKKINLGEDFQYPVGKGTVLGNKLKLSSSQPGTILWTVEFFTPNSTYTSFNAPLTYVNSHEYWTVSAPTGSQAKININWDSNSDLTPLNTLNGLSDMRVALYNTGTSLWDQVVSSAGGSNSLGTVSTLSRVTMPIAGSDNFTTACINVIKPKAKLTPTGPVCGTSGIPVTFSPAPTLDYTITYSLDGIVQLPITFTGAPYILPTPTPGSYKLVSFTYNGGITGAVDPGTVVAYALPTTANSGMDQSLCGLSVATLAGNTPTIGTGLWSIVSGTGGTVTSPTVPTSTFNGTNGTAYNLQWTISNGGCVSSDQVNVVFPILAAQPAAFTTSSSNVCNLQTGVVYTVPLDPTVSYIWEYTPDDTGVNINGTSNSVTLDFDNTATSGTLSVTAFNGCGSSTPRTLGITVNPVPLVSLTSNDADNIICGGATVLFTANGTPPPTITSYDFQVDGVSVQNTASNTYSTSTLVDGNVVSVIAMAAGSCTTTSNAITMSVADGIWTGAVSTDWFDATNWSCGGIPTQVKDIIVPNGVPNMPVINGSGAEFRDIVIQNAASLTTNASYNADVYGEWENDGSFFPNTGTVTFRESSIISGSATHTFNNIIISAAKTLTAYPGIMNITGDLTNNGIFNHNNGTLIMNGTVIQNIDGVGNFYNLEIDNSMGVNLSINAVISNGLTLTDGVVNTGGNTMRFSATASVSPSSGLINSYINGKVIKTIVGSGFTFPIGSADRWRPAFVTNVSAAGYAWEAEYFVGPATNENPPVVNLTSADPLVLTLSSIEYWKISDGNVAPLGVTAEIGLSWGTASAVSSNAADRDMLVVMAWNDGTTLWDNKGGTAHLGSSAAGTLQSTGTLSFSENIVTLGSLSESNPLPVTLVSFTGKEQDGTVVLNWKTATELNNDYFLVEHSVDGKVFEEIGEVTGAGTTNIAQDYTFEHRRPAYPSNYYRLKQVDFDGAYEYSDIILVRLKNGLSNENPDFVMYPNPTSEKDVNIELSAPDYSKSLLIEVVNINGTRIVSEMYKTGEFGNYINLKLGQKAKQGVYIVRISQGDYQMVKKLVLQ